MTKKKTNSKSVGNLTFGQRLKELRNRQQWTCEVLAEKVGITPEYISMMENGHREPRFPMVEKISKAFGLTLAQFMEGVR